jgi:hypothetical protein
MRMVSVYIIVNEGFMDSMFVNISVYDRIFRFLKIVLFFVFGYDFLYNFAGMCFVIS